MENGTTRWLRGAFEPEPPSDFGCFATGPNLLWSIKPVNSGCTVASKDHIISSPASISGYAIGIRAY